MTPRQAWDEAIKEGRSELRPCRPDAWWPYIWSVRSKIRVDVDGTVPVGKQRVKITPTYRRTAIHCQHPDGSVTYLAEPPGSGGLPVVLYRYENSSPKWHI